MLGPSQVTFQLFKILAFEDSIYSSLGIIVLDFESPDGHCSCASTECFDRANQIFRWLSCHGCGLGGWPLRIESICGECVGHKAHIDVVVGSEVDLNGSSWSFGIGIAAECFLDPLGHRGDSRRRSFDISFSSRLLYVRSREIGADARACEMLRMAEAVR